ncbi:hypothetical protein I7I48_00363 [Histoplasma ohiense]|nr:hypothetical protein I7I48_00363 [Histoplasma ohiense (nom. inval.)]
MLEFRPMSRLVGGAPSYQHIYCVERKSTTRPRDCYSVRWKVYYFEWLDSLSRMSPNLDHVERDRSLSDITSS